MGKRTKMTFLQIDSELAYRQLVRNIVAIHGKFSKWDLEI